jgi:hypothetical protein
VILTRDTLPAPACGLRDSHHVLGFSARLFALRIAEEYENIAHRCEKQNKPATGSAEKNSVQGPN